MSEIILDSVIDLSLIHIQITVEEIQDSVENVLIQAGYADVAKAYILYRKPVSYTHLDVYKRQAYRCDRDT